MRLSVHIQQADPTFLLSLRLVSNVVPTVFHPRLYQLNLQTLRLTLYTFWRVQNSHGYLTNPSASSLRQRCSSSKLLSGPPQFLMRILIGILLALASALSHSKARAKPMRRINAITATENTCSRFIVIINLNQNHAGRGEPLFP